MLPRKVDLDFDRNTSCPQNHGMDQGPRYQKPGFRSSACGITWHALPAHQAPLSRDGPGNAGSDGFFTTGFFMVFLLGILDEIDIPSGKLT